MAIELTEQDLDCSRALLEILEANPDCAKIVSLDGRITSVNENGRCFVGAPSAEALKDQPWTTFLPETFWETAQEGFEQACQGETVRLVAPCRTLAGSRHCDYTLSPLRRADGGIVALLVITRDIHDLVEARMRAEERERELTRQTAALKAAGSMAKFGAWEFDYHDGRVFLSDELWGLMRGAPRLLSPEEGLTIFSPQDRDWITTTLIAARKSKKPFRFDVEVRREDDTAMWVRFFGAADLSSGLSGVLRGGALDITEQRHAEQALIDARDAAQAATQSKSAFLANMSHEIRTPLHGILGMSQVMERDVLSEEQRSSLALIRRSGETLMALLNDILDISKIEAGRLALDVRSFDLADMLDTACAPFGYLAELKDLSFGWTVTEAAKGSWIGDDARLRQILTNLVSNALKFTAAGSIAVAADAHDDFLQLSVTDTGVGIALEFLPSLFGKFAQADTSTTRKYGGSGLGLAICRELTELMGGEIFAESIYGKGATFWVRIPLSRAPTDETQARTAAPEQVLSGVDRTLRILAAEDNPMNQLILRAMLDPLDVELTLTADGDEAIAATQAETFDLILMDIQMPGCNGVDATRAIRALEQSQGKPCTPIVALTANVMAHQRAEYQQAGMDGLVEKPIEISALYAAIGQALGAAPQVDGRP
jgi:PAS domain S-box-containing protein